MATTRSPDGRSVVGDGGDLDAGEGLGQRRRLADGGRGAHERGIGAVVGRDATQTAQHVGDVAAEDAPEQVQLVDHDVLEPGEEPHPTGVVREDPAVEHLGVGEQDRGVAPGLGPLVAPHVAVVRGGHHAGQIELDERPELIVGQGLRRVDAQRGPRSGGGKRGLADGRLVHEGLPRRRAGGHGDGTTVAHEVERLGLVRVQPVDAEPVPHGCGQRPGEVAVARRRGGDALEVHQAVRFRQMGFIPLDQPAGAAAGRAIRAAAETAARASGKEPRPSVGLRGRR